MLKICCGRGKLNPTGMSLRKGGIRIGSTALSARLLTEGRNTGIPTIQRELAHNGSPAASFETDEDRLSFLVRIPCHEGEEGISPAFIIPEVNDKENNNSDKETLSNGVNALDDRVKEVNDTINPIDDTINSGNDTINDTINSGNDTITELSEIHIRVAEAIRIKPEITRQEMMGILKVSDRTISRALKRLQDLHVITREGSRKNGRWIILK